MAHETWDMNTPDGRAKAAAAGLYDGPIGTPKRNGGGDGQKSKKRQKRTDLTPAQQAFLAACQAHGLPEPVPEYRFDPTRKWRFDWLFDAHIALEIEGGTWVGGRHVRGDGYVKDLEKYNAAQLAGYVLLRVTPQQVKSGEAFALIAKALATT